MNDKDSSNNNLDNKAILQGELQTYRPKGWTDPSNYTSYLEYMFKSMWYLDLKAEEKGQIAC